MCLGNRVYDEIANRREEFPEAFRLLALIDNGVPMPGEALPLFERYDLSEDSWELNDLAADPAHQAELRRLLQQLQAWAVRTDDRYTALKSLSADPDTRLLQLAEFNLTERPALSPKNRRTIPIPASLEK